MPQVKPEVETFARIKVAGTGGSGVNAINHMINSKVKGVDFIAINTDAQDLHHSPAKKKIHIGKNVTRGLGAGMNPEVGRKAIEETKEEVQEALKGADMVFIASGLGGGTGSGASPIVARTAREVGALTVAVVTKPFFFEGQQRMKIANQALSELRKEVDAIIVVPNDKLLEHVEKDTLAKNAFALSDDILKSAVEGISDLITTPGIINIDFADIKAIMSGAGSALMGIGIASGENRAAEAAKAAINSPLLDISINGAKGVLFSIAGGDDLTMHEIQDAAKTITESTDPEARVIFGTIKDDSLNKGELKVTLIASGFPNQGTVAASAPQTADSKKSIFGKKESTTEAVQEGKIFNTLEKREKPEDSEIPSIAEKKSENQAKPKTEDDLGDEDEWSAVPAFLRRSKIK